MLDSKIKIGIIDLGINNIHSIANAYLLIGCKVKIISKKENLLKYNIIVLPGVGSFKSAIKKTWNWNLKHFKGEENQYKKKFRENRLRQTLKPQLFLEDASSEIGCFPAAAG